MRKLLLVSIALLIVLLFLGCSIEKTTPGGGAASAGPVELVLYTWTEVTEANANQELLAKFTAEHPNITVKLQNVPGSQEAMQKLQTMFAGDTAPDVMSLHGAYYVPFASKGVLLDLESQAQRDAKFALTDFYPGLLEISRYEGQLFSIPRYTSVYTLFYNKDKFDAAGLPYPGTQGEWTWDRYLEACRKLTRDTNGDGRPDEYGTYIDFWGSRMFPWIWQAGGEIMNQQRTKATVDSPPVIEAISFLSDLRHKYKVTPPTTSAERNEGLDLFVQGKLGMYMTGPWDVQGLKQAKSLNWDVAPLPQRKQQATLLGTENYAISAKTKHPQEAWELFKFLLSPDSQEFMARRLDKMPSRRSVAEGFYTTDPAGYNRAVFVEALGYAKQAPNIPEWDEVGKFLQDQLDLIWVGKQQPAAGMKLAAQQINEALAKLRAGG